MTVRRDSRIYAVLGPTNTGKTHTAIERMIGHHSGMIGFPLRLLARENFDRVVARKGAGRVALITGEEKIIPRNPSYFICTVESMPLDVPVDFLAIDECQLAADPERGHIFTDRILYARGREETMLLGSDTIETILSRLVPEAEVVRKVRLSTLTHTGVKKLNRLPPRTAVVTFSAQDVYHTAEMMRRQGGAAVVLGALSPRTRNAQVEMYQAGEVDYLVATDAIGMGLNMDIDHVAFARLRKFDGAQPRRLRPQEIAQIAGRAGRHMSDGTFGTLSEVGELDPDVVEAVETHTFDPIEMVMWRSRDLDFRDPKSLLKSLERRPEDPLLWRARDADDHQSLAALIRDPEVRATAEKGSKAATRLLWDVCQIPDFRKLLSDAHTRLLADIFRRLMATGGADGGTLQPDWVAEQVRRFDRTDGDIDTLVTRIAHVRTWTYISHRTGWVPDARHWQGRTRALEDRLSDALHDRLTQRFVDRRAAVLTKSLKEGRVLDAEIAEDGTVTVEGHFTGRLQGFVFLPDESASGDESRALQQAARKTLNQEFQRRITAVSEAEEGAISLNETGRFVWREQEIARLNPGDELLKPKITLISTEDMVDSVGRDRVLKKLSEVLHARMATVLEPMVKLGEEPPTGPAGGIVFQLIERGGWMRRYELNDLIQGLDRDQRRALGKGGVRLGPNHVYMPALLKPKAVALLALLMGVKEGWTLPVPVPPPSIAAVMPSPELPPARLSRFGYQPCGSEGPAVRLDRLDALAVEAMQRINKDQMIRHPETLAPLAGLTRLQLPYVLDSLGYRPKTVTLPKEQPAEAAKPEQEAAVEESQPDATPSEGVAEADAPLPPATGDTPAESQAEPPVDGASPESASEPSGPETAVDGMTAVEAEAPPSDQGSQDESPVQSAQDEPPVEGAQEEASTPDTPTDAASAPASETETPLLEPSSEPDADAAATSAGAVSEPTTADVAEPADVEMEEVEVWVRQRRGPPNRGGQRPNRNRDADGGDERRGPRRGRPGNQGGDRGNGQAQSGDGQTSSKDRPPRKPRHDSERWAESGAKPGGRSGGPKAGQKGGRGKPGDRGPRTFESGPAPSLEDSPFAKLAALKPQIEAAQRDTGKNGKSKRK